MYTVNKTRSRKKLFLQFVSTVIVIFAVLALVVWFFVFRNNNSSSASFESAGGNVTAVVEPATETFTTDHFEITLPEGWESQGKKRPNVDSEFYAFKSEVENYDNRWLNVYVDVYPDDYELNRMLDIKPNGSSLEAGELSGDCKTFKGAPTLGTQATTQSWTAKWQGIEFNCNMSGTNHSGTASEEHGYGVPVAGETSGQHKYFFVYIDHNVRPDYTILTKAVESFKAI